MRFWNAERVRRVKDVEGHRTETLAHHHADMQPASKTYARIGRSYPRWKLEAEVPARLPRRYRVMAGLLAVFSALGLIGWLLAR